MCRKPNRIEVVAVIHVRSGSYCWQLFRLLSVAGEFPAQSLSILGNERSVKAMVHKLESVQTIRVQSGAEYRTQMFSVSGWGEKRTVRLHKGALQILDELQPGTYESYMADFYDHHFPGGARHILRNHRVAEALCMMELAGIEYLPCSLAQLHTGKLRPVVPESPCFYASRYLKRLVQDSMSKTIYTRVVGLLFYPGGAYAVYNIRDAAMRLTITGEEKTRRSYSELAKINADVKRFDSALLFGRNADAAYRTLMGTELDRKKPRCLDAVYRHIHFIPMDPNGVRLLNILSLPDWRVKMREALFPGFGQDPSEYSRECDAYLDGVYVLSYLDGDIARLMRFKSSAECDGSAAKTEIIAYPWQREFLRSYLGDRMRIRLLDMEAVERALGLR